MTARHDSSRPASPQPAAVPGAVPKKAPTGATPLTTRSPKMSPHEDAPTSGSSAPGDDTAPPAEAPPGEPPR